MFGKKTEKFMKAWPNYYEGLPGFEQNSGCMITEDETSFVFSDYVNKREAKLAKSQLINLDILDNQTFLQKYKNTEAKPRKNYEYCIFTYRSSEGEVKEIVVSGEPVQTLPIHKLKLRLMKQDKAVETVNL